MAITWGDYDDNLQVGIDVSISGTTVTVKYYVRTSSGGFNWADTQTLTRTDWITGTTSFYNDLTDPSEQMLVYQTTKTGSRGSSYKVGAKISGAFNGATPSHSRTFTIPAVEPDAPGRPTVSDVQDDRVDVTCTAPADNGGASILEYEYRWADNSSYSGATDQSAGSSRSDVLTGLPSGTDLWVKVRARNSAGWGPYSSSRTFRTIGVPGKPGLPVIDQITRDSARATWTEPSTWDGDDTGDYVVTLDDDEAFGSPMAFSISALTTVLESLDPATDYFIKVAATNSAGTGPASNVATFRTLSGMRFSDGSAWQDGEPSFSDGAAWQGIEEIKVSDGTTWKALA